MGRNRRSRNSNRSGRSDASRTRNTSNSPPRSPKRRRVESELDDSRAERRRRLGEEVEGRVHVISDKVFREKNPALREHKKKKHATQLRPKSVELHVEANREEHNTGSYDMEELVIRRAKTFVVSVTFDRSFDATNDRIFLQFVTGPRPQENKKSLIRVPVVQKLDNSKWGMKITESNGDQVKLSVMTAADAAVGKYGLFVETKTKFPGSDVENSFRKEFSNPIYILFNAWCKDDAVYMADEDQRQEYVLNDHGRIWVGNVRHFKGIPWNFGQFEEVVLTTCLYLLDKAEVSPAARANPLQVARVISQMANYNDKDGGILFGRWTSDYPKNSTPPTAWTGSVAICEKYARKHYVVRYGQCWVFSGLVTTLLRALGIPTRSVTNFESAHDTDSSMTIDYHFDKKGNPLDDLNDSVWNFHVWNESYFTRPDLPKGYDGWQAHDATPQETSEGVFRCGPCPVKAIKEGNVYIPYDGGFIFAEVNGDKVYWQVDDDGEMEVSYINKTSVGRYISTKAVGSNEREDLTHQYKYPEGSDAERQAIHRAHKFSSRKDENIYSLNNNKDVDFEVLVDEKVQIGNDVLIGLRMKNNSKEVRKVDAAINVKAAFYTGVVSQNIKECHEELTLKEGQEKDISIHIKPEDYYKLLADDVCIKVFFHGKVLETNQIFATMETIDFEKPELEAFFLTDDIQVNEEFDMALEVENPLPFKLTNGIFLVESSRMKPKDIERRLKRPVEPGKMASDTISLLSNKKGRRYVEASFQCDQIKGIRGEFEVKIN